MYNTREELDALGRALEQGARGVRLMADLNDLYQEVILDHNRRPRNFHALADASHRAEGYNPLCGDRLTLYLKLDDGVISEVGVRGRRLRHFEGVGLDDDRRDQGTHGAPTRAALFERFHRMVTTPPDQAGRGHGQAVGRSPACASFPMRVKCASLAWHTFKAAIEREQIATTEKAGEGL